MKTWWSVTKKFLVLQIEALEQELETLQAAYSSKTLGETQ